MSVVQDIIILLEDSDPCCLFRTDRSKNVALKIFFTKSLHVTLKKNALNDLLRAMVLISFSLL